MAFGIQSLVEVQKGVLNNADQFVAVPQSGTVTINGTLSGEIGREIEFTATEALDAGYQFKKWIIETTPLTIREVSTSLPYGAYEEICLSNGEAQTQTAISTTYFTDGQFLYENQEGTRLAPYGYYGIGGQEYYIHSATIGLRGPFTCGSSQSGGNTSGGGSTDTNQATSATQL